MTFSLSGFEYSPILCAARGNLVPLVCARSKNSWLSLGPNSGYDLRYKIEEVLEHGGGY